MKDFIENDLNLDDYVILTNCNYKHLIIGKIDKITEKTVSVIIPISNSKDRATHKKCSNVQLYKPNEQIKFKEIFEINMKDRRIID